jgi:hypothetical protein
MNQPSDPSLNTQTNSETTQEPASLCDLPPVQLKHTLIVFETPSHLYSLTTGQRISAVTGSLNYVHSSDSLVVKMVPRSPLCIKLSQALEIMFRYMRWLVELDMGYTIPTPYSDMENSLMFHWTVQSVEPLINPVELTMPQTTFLHLAS